MAKQKLYTLTAVEISIETLTKHGYDINVIPGSLLDNYICIPPDNDKYIFEVREVYLNVCSSAYSMRRHSKLSKRLIKEIDQSIEMLEMEH